MIILVSAPTNLGLRPPQIGSVPGTAKAPEALREAGFHEQLVRLGAREGGVVLPETYLDDDASRSPETLRNQDQIIDHSRRLAERIAPIVAAGDTPLVLGGDCSLLLGAGLALASHQRSGLIHLDGHTDFRHPGNSTACASLAGEDLAAAVGMHWPAIANIDGLGPYFPADRAAHIGHRPSDEEAAEAAQVLGLTLPATSLTALGAGEVAARAMRVAGSEYWLQLDVDILDPSVFPAVDSPDPGGLMPEELIELLRALAPSALGASVTVFDPDLDPTGSFARLLSEILLAGLSDLGSARRENTPTR